MKPLAGVLVAFLVLAASPAAAQCTSKPAEHERWAVKTRAKPAGGVHAERITVAQLIAIDIPHRTDTPKTVIAGSVEETIYSLDAWVMLAKCAADDSDLHLEVAGSRSVTAPRVIVEIPGSNKNAQALVAKFLGLTKVGTTPKRFTAATAVQLHFIGYGFFDLSHASKTFKKSGDGSHGSKAVATILELHPVFAVMKVQ